MDELVYEALLSARLRAIESFIAQVGIPEQEFTDGKYTLRIEALPDAGERLSIIKLEEVASTTIEYKVEQEGTQLKVKK